MPAESAAVFGVILGGVAIFFLLAPLLVTLATLPAIWREDLSNGLLIGGVVVLTGICFIVYFIGLAGVILAKPGA